MKHKIFCVREFIKLSWRLLCGVRFVFVSTFSGSIWKFRISSFKCYVDHPHTMYSSGSIYVRNWVHLLESQNSLLTVITFPPSVWMWVTTKFLSVKYFWWCCTNNRPVVTSSLLNRIKIWIYFSVNVYYLRPVPYSACVSAWPPSYRSSFNWNGGEAFPVTKLTSSMQQSYNEEVNNSLAAQDIYIYRVS